VAVPERAGGPRLAPSTPVRDVQILEETIYRSVAVERFRQLVVVSLAVLAAALALLGVYGAVIAVAVTVVSGLAAWLPARKAASVDPVSVLNSE
jgi:ABC-type lipoprotein release transport system permease subunit